jgi:hypothetical protein
VQTQTGPAVLIADYTKVSLWVLVDGNPKRIKKETILST